MRLLIEGDAHRDVHPHCAVERVIHQHVTDELFVGDHHLYVRGGCAGGGADAGGDGGEIAWLLP
jgi:hypothetical protein